MGTCRRVLGFGLLLVALAALGGCRGRRLVRTGVAGGGGTTSGAVQLGGGAQTAHGTPRQQLDQLDQLLRGQGYAPAGPATQASLAQNGITAYAIEVRRGQCYVLSVLGQPGTDVNLVMLDPAGRDIGHDVQTDAHPWVGFCTARAGRFVARVQQARGQGEYFFATYVADGRHPVDLRAFFGVEEAGPQLATLDATTGQRLAGLDQQLAAQRYQRVGEPNGLVLENRAERNFQVSLEQGRCYTFAALGGPGATDTDLFLQDGSGQRLAADTATTQDAMLQYCAADAGSFTLRARMFAGAGPLFTVAYVQAAEGTAAAPEALEPVLADTSTGGASLDEGFALLDADMQARGYQHFLDAQRGQVGPAGVEFAIELEGNKCYALVALGDAGTRTLSIALRDARGRDVEHDDSGDARPTVRICPSTPGRYTLAVQAAAGAGDVVFAPYVWPRGTRLGDLQGVLYVRLAEVTALLGVEGFLPDPNYGVEPGRLRRQGQSTQHPVQLQGGLCYSLVVVGGDGIRDLDLTLSSGGTQVATDVGGQSAFPSVRYCPPQSGTFQLGVQSPSGAGNYIYQVFGQQSGGAVGG